MKAIWARIKLNPTVVAAVVSLLTAIVGAIVKNEALAGALVGVAVAFLGLRQIVTPVTKAAEVAVTAATEAATRTAEALTEATVGVVDDVTDAGKVIVSSVTRDVVADTVGPALGEGVGAVRDVLSGVGGLLGGGRRAGQ